jgi:hypothetical protein
MYRINMWKKQKEKTRKMKNRQEKRNAESEHKVK